MNRISTLAAAFALAASAHAGAQEVRKDLAYAVRGAVEMKLDLYLPKGPGPHPLALVLHSGGWFMGSRKFPEVTLTAERLVEEGFAAAAASYRLAPKHVHPAQIEDCRRALQFLRAHAQEFGVDPTRVLAVGLSAGAHLAALLGAEDDRARPDAADPIDRQSTRPQCVVAFSGPFVLDKLEDATPFTTNLVSRFLIGKEKPDPADVSPATLAKARDASPLYHVSRGDAPMFVVYGDRDGLVPTSQAEAMDVALARCGVPHETVLVKGGGHGDYLGALWYRRPNRRPEWERRAWSFVRKHLRISGTVNMAAAESRPNLTPAKIRRALRNGASLLICTLSAGAVRPFFAG